MSHTTAATATAVRAARGGRLRANAVRIAAATVTAAAALTLTACGADDSSGTKTEGRADSAPSMETAAKDAAGESGSDGTESAGKGDASVGQGDGTGGSEGTTPQDSARTGGKGPGVEGAKEQPTEAGGTEGGGEDAGPTSKPCTVGETKVALEHTGGTIPAITLRLTNTGSTACDAYYLPLVGYPDAQAPLAAGGEKPQAVATVQPGASTTATIGLGSEDGSSPHREQRLTVTLVDADNKPLPGQATVSAPAGAGLLLDDSSSVTYWGRGLDSL
ncbi:DUF4232 domain-containing protein [Streptomyces sp. NPDC057702]|uniref:DUF4232 domain-containing protein n=1 Tax=unclassified Streptomyces TaxID=2593676 RepID=UPI00369A689F